MDKGINQFLSKSPSRNLATSLASVACPERHCYKACSLSSSCALNFRDLCTYFWYRKALVKEGKFGEEKDLLKPTGAYTPLPTNTQRMHQLRKKMWDLRVSSKALLRDHTSFWPT